MVDETIRSIKEAEQQAEEILVKAAETKRTDSERCISSGKADS